MTCGVVLTTLSHYNRLIYLYVALQYVVFKYTMFHKKTTPDLITHNFGKCFPIFNFFHFWLSSDCAMNWSLKIPSHLIRVDTLPCKTLVFKNWLISTLINTSCSLFVFRHELVNRIIVFSDIWSDLSIYSAISHYIIFFL